MRFVDLASFFPIILHEKGTHIEATCSHFTQFCQNSHCRCSFSPSTYNYLSILLSKKQCACRCVQNDVNNCDFISCKKSGFWSLACYIVHFCQFLQEYTLILKLHISTKLPVNYILQLKYIHDKSIYVAKYLCTMNFNGGNQTFVLDFSKKKNRVMPRHYNRQPKTSNWFRKYLLIGSI